MAMSDAIIKDTDFLIGRYGTRDPFRIAKELGINIMYTDKLDRLKGMYRIIKRNRFIILNGNNSEAMGRIVCAHELGHDRLHGEYARTHPLAEFVLYDMTTKREYEANLFAASLLLPDGDMLEYIKAGYDTPMIAGITETDINLVALKTDLLIRAGYGFKAQEHNSKFLK